VAIREAQAGLRGYPWHRETTYKKEGASTQEPRVEELGPPSEQKHQKDDQQDQTEATTIVMVRRSIIESTSTEQENQNDQENDQSHRLLLPWVCRSDMGAGSVRAPVFECDERTATAAQRPGPAPRRADDRQS
jgi:hypothetical protein